MSGRSSLQPKWIAREEGLGVDAALGRDRAPAARSTSETVPAAHGKPGTPDASADRREDVDQLDRGPTRPAERAPSFGQLHEERDLEDLAVEEDAVLVLAVLAEPLAVVREEDDERPVVEPLRRRRSRNFPTIASALAISPS